MLSDLCLICMAHMAVAFCDFQCCECHWVPSGDRSCGSAPDWSAPFGLYQLAMPVRRVRSKLRSWNMLKIMICHGMQSRSDIGFIWFYDVLCHINPYYSILGTVYWQHVLAQSDNLGHDPLEVSCMFTKEGRRLQTSMHIWRSRACYPQAWNVLEPLWDVACGGMWTPAGTGEVGKVQVPIFSQNHRQSRVVRSWWLLIHKSWVDLEHDI